MACFGVDAPFGVRIDSQGITIITSYHPFLRFKRGLKRVVWCSHSQLHQANAKCLNPEDVNVPEMLHATCLRGSQLSVAFHPVIQSRHGPLAWALQF